MTERLFAVVRQVKAATDGVVPVSSSWDVTVVVVDQSKRGGRPKRG